MDMLGIGSDAFAGPIEDTSDGAEWSNAPPAPEPKATSVTAAAQQTTRPTTGKTMDNPALNLAILSDVPADVCAMLGQAEAECLRFFALPDAVKRRCTAANNVEKWATPPTALAHWPLGGRWRAPHLARMAAAQARAGSAIPIYYRERGMRWPSF